MNTANNVHLNGAGLRYQFNEAVLSQEARRLLALARRQSVANALALRPRRKAAGDVRTRWIDLPIEFFTTLEIATVNLSEFTLTEWRIPEELLVPKRPERSLNAAGKALAAYLLTHAPIGVAWTPAEWLEDYGRDYYQIESHRYVLQMCREAVIGRNQPKPYRAHLPFPWRAIKSGRQWQILADACVGRGGLYVE